MEDENYKRLCMFLALIVFLLIFVLGAKWFSDYREDKKIELNQTMVKSFSEGVWYGRSTTVIEMMSILEGCGVVQLSNMNVTIDMVNIDCERQIK